MTTTEKQIDFAVDFVYSFIDGSEEKLVERKKQLLTSTNSKLNVNSATPMRWRAWGELEQSICATLRFAPWVRKIFVVSPNSVPEWFQQLSNTVSASKTQLVWISECTITGNEAMFNSHVAETCLHLIPDLSEHFVYLCDEMFMGRPVERNLFFTDDGIPILHVRFSERKQFRNPQFLGSTTMKSVDPVVTGSVKELVVSNSAYRKKPSAYLYAWEGALATANACLDVLESECKLNSVTTLHSHAVGHHDIAKVHSHGGLVRMSAGAAHQNGVMVKPPTLTTKQKSSEFPRPELMHCCTPLLKQGFVELWKHRKIQPILEKTRMSVFRKTTDVHAVYLVSIYLLMTQRATYYGFKSKMQSSTHSNTLRRPTMLYAELVHLADSIKKLKRGYDVYCLNDAHDLPPKACAQIVTMIKTQLPHHIYNNSR